MAVILASRNSNQDKKCSVYSSHSSVGSFRYFREKSIDKYFENKKNSVFLEPKYRTLRYSEVILQLFSISPQQNIFLLMIG